MEGVDGGGVAGLDLKGKAGDLLLPGDIIGHLVDTRTPPDSTENKELRNKRSVIRLGPGVTQRDDDLHAVKCGLLCADGRRGKVWLSGNQRRYVASMDDMVIGVVIERHGDEYRLDINGVDTVTLPALAFEGATKKNRPQLTIGSCVYARIVRAGRATEGEVSCVEVGSAKSWVGGETLFGELKGGNVVGVSLALARALMLGSAGVLERIGEKIAFQSAVGVNGRVWVQAGGVRETMVVTQAILKADVLEKEEWLKFLQRLFAQG